MLRFLSTFLCVACVLRPSECVHVEHAGYDALYRSAVEAFLQESWEACVNYMEKALRAREETLARLVDCRRRCTSHIFHPLTVISSRFDLFVDVIRSAECLENCRNRHSGKVADEVEEDFEQKVPFEYLYKCYSEVGNLDLAASSAYTYLAANPEDEAMEHNLQINVKISHVKKENIFLLDPKPYQEAYLEAVQFYQRKKYDKVIERIKTSLEEYLKALEDCKLLCESVNTEAALEEELIINIASQLLHVYSCKTKCPEKLSFFYGQSHPNLFASFYHYLQFSYYQVNKLAKACEAVASYLLFLPDDSSMLSNKAFYSRMDGVQTGWFKPEKNAVKYFNSLNKEQEILKQASQFLINTISKPKSGSSGKGKAQVFSNSFTDEDLTKNVLVTLNAETLNGSLRFVADNFSTKEDCESLIHLANTGAVQGDGYNGVESPLTKFEIFQGLSIGRIALLEKEGVLNGSEAKLFFDLSEKARAYVQMQFNLTSYLYFSYTHLVCRTALSAYSRLDMSHPVHADNCLLQATGACIKKYPAYTWRDYSAILYLNDDFEGGEFIFAKDQNTVQATVHPKCGRLVAFSSGKENLHGVKAVKEGRRCALAMWYTLDAKHRERTRHVAEQMLLKYLRKEFNVSLKVTNEISNKSFQDHKVHYMEHHAEL